MIEIDLKSRKPLYEQIIDNIKSLIVQGIWTVDTQLPTVRQLANELAINPNTIQKAYSELERQGVIYSLKSKGSFVAGSVDFIKAERKSRLLAELTTGFRELLDLGATVEEITDLLQKEQERRTI